MEEKYASMSLEEAIRDIYSFSKDQYGCRFFQKKLEEPNTEQRDLIFIQTFPYFTELMTGKNNKLNKNSTGNET